MSGGLKVTATVEERPAVGSFGPKEPPSPPPSRPLGEVLARAIPDFTPEHPRRAPWAREQLDRVEHAYTGNLAVVNLAVADRVHLHGLDRPSYEQDWLEPSDWTPAGWGVSSR